MTQNLIIFGDKMEDPPTKTSTDLNSEARLAALTEKLKRIEVEAILLS